MPLGQVVDESSHRLYHVNCPSTAVISLLYVMEDEASAEIAIVGDEGSGALHSSWGRTTPVARSCRSRRPLSATGNVLLARERGRGSLTAAAKPAWASSWSVTP